MENEITYTPVKQKSGKPNIVPQSGWIVLCQYCGEQIGNTQRFCSICRKKEGRQGILKENIEVLKQLREKGFCQNKVELLAV